MKIHVLAVLALASVAAAAPPQCALDTGQGTLTGLSAAMVPPSFCENDPGHGPDYATLWAALDNYNPCAPGVFEAKCREAQIAWWHTNLVTEVDDNYRKAVCACHTDHVGDPPALALCLQVALDQYNDDNDGSAGIGESRLRDHCDCVGIARVK